MALSLSRAAVGWGAVPPATSVFIVQRQDEGGNGGGWSSSFAAVAGRSTTCCAMTPSPPGGRSTACCAMTSSPAVGGARAVAIEPVGGTAARGSSVVCSWSCRHTLYCRREEGVGTPHEVTDEGDFKDMEDRKHMAYYRTLDRSCIFGLLSLHPCQSAHTVLWISCSFWLALPPSLPAHKVLRKPTTVQIQLALQDIDTSKDSTRRYLKWLHVFQQLPSRFACALLLSIINRF